ncbi:unnamed protein product, partial [Strongylus vulgaris]
VTTDQNESNRAPQLVANRIVGNGNIQDLPPTIPRYEGSAGSYTGRTISRVLSPASRPSVVHATSAPVRSSGGGKLLMVRRSDGTTQFLRQIPQGEESNATHLPVVKTRSQQPLIGSRIVRVASRQDQPTSTRLVSAHGVEVTTARQGIEQTVDPFMKRMAMEKAASGSVTASQGAHRRQVGRPAEAYEEIYYEPSEDQVVYTDGVRPITRPSNRYGQNTVISRMVPRSSNAFVGRSQASNVRILELERTEDLEKKQIRTKSAAKRAG